MSSGYGAFHVYYEKDGVEVRKAYASYNDAEKARIFLEALGFDVGLDMNKKKKVWEP